MPRPSNRRPDEMRPVSIIRHYTRHAEGSVMVSFGDTRVLCNASIEERVPPFLRNQRKGWITAEYGLLPRSTSTRTDREAARGKQTGRTLEIQRLIGRSLRATVNTARLGERTITVDCDVIQADGGTRTAAITGAWIALRDAVNWLLHHEIIDDDPIHRAVSAVSVGIFEGQVVTDLDYREDSRAETDMNIVMDSQGKYIEVQGTAEGAPFDRSLLDQMLNHGEKACRELLEIQQRALED